MINVLCIIGTSYCGSTLLGLQIGSLDNCASIGELYNRAFRGEESSYGVCSECLDGCEYWTEKFIKSLKFDDVYNKIAERFSVTNLIDCSKLPAYFTRYIFPANADNQSVNLIPVIMYKNPLESKASFKMYKNGTFMTFYKEIYADALNTAAKYSNSIILSCKDYAEKNEKYLEYLCSVIGETYDPAIQEYWNFKHHQLGGNQKVHISRNEKYYSDSLSKLIGGEAVEREKPRTFKKIEYRERHRELLTTDEIDWIINDTELQEIYKTLESKRLILG